MTTGMSRLDLAIFIPFGVLESGEIGLRAFIRAQNRSSFRWHAVGRCA